MKNLNLFLITITFLFTSAALKAQENSTKISNDPGVTIAKADSGVIFTAVEHEPEFPGGKQGFYKYLSDSLKYPDKARDNDIRGGVFVSVVVENDGSLSHIKISRSLTRETDAEAIRVLKESPKWIPGIQNGKLARVAYTVGIPFPFSKQNKN